MLYAPTFRGSVGGAKAPDAMDLCLMQEKLGKDWILLIKQHPVVKQKQYTVCNQLSCQCYDEWMQFKLCYEPSIDETYDTTNNDNDQDYYRDWQWLKIREHLCCIVHRLQ